MVAVTGLLLSAAIPSVWQASQSHTYFNAMAGGPAQGYEHLGDSNIHWGQDLVLLQRWVDQHPHEPLDGIAYRSMVPLELLGIQAPRPPWVPSDVEVRLTPSLRDPAKIGPLPGRYALFIDVIVDYESDYRYFLELRPREVLGHTCYIYDLSIDDVNPLRASMNLPLLASPPS